MDSPEAAKLRALLTELDRLCADAERIRRKISDVTHQRPLWPDKRAHSSFNAPFGETHDLATVPDAERNN